ncbi:MAG: carboxypeptidase regulatory-like domain-containing protein [Kofleriaceae bacterium]
MRATEIAIALSVLTFAGCGPEKRGGNDGDGGTGPQDAPCNTTISGKVFAPNGTLPLYGVTVYVPGTPPPPFTDGVQCGSCEGDLPGGALTRTESGTDGSFRLDNVPPGQTTTVILTTGKWRRIVNVPVSNTCGDNALPDGTFRLPRNRNEGEIPRIAMVTGSFDSLACIFTKMGIDPNEFGDASSGDKRIVFYNGSGGVAPGSPQPSTALWGNLDELKKFDAVINSCEGSEHPENKTSPDLLRQYADLGGRIFGTHYHYIWAKTLIPEWQSTTTWGNGSTAGPDMIDTSHPKGMALAEWLVNVGASTTLGQITGLTQKTTDAIGVPPTTRRWMYGSGSPVAVHYLSFDTPVSAPDTEKCGRVVYAGMHVSQSTNTVDANFPAGCSAGLESDEKALIFLLFDLGSCTGTIF